MLIAEIMSFFSLFMLVLMITGCYRFMNYLIGESSVGKVSVYSFLFLTIQWLPMEEYVSCESGHIFYFYLISLS
uniref:Uncharacterized protein n=1 Tax=Rhizophora mucronata TaxID=61149 RepID=A0A2P2K6M8_RHIMU